jgi:zinc protease
MKHHINRESDYSLATITASKIATVTAYITIDVHKERTVTDQAVQMMYPETLLSGTEKKTRAEFLHAANLLGGSVGISVRNSNVTITLQSTAVTFPKLLKLVEEMLVQPAFAKTELGRIKHTVTNELHESKEDSKGIAQEELLNTFYGSGDRKFSCDIDDTIAAVKEISIKNVKSLHMDVMTGAWACSIAAEKSNCDLFEKFIKKTKKLHTLRVTESIHQQKPPNQTISVKNIPSKQNIDFSIGAPLPFTLHHPDYVPLSFGIAVLAMWGGFAGRLMSIVREKEGLTYGIYGQLEGFTGTEQGYWRIMTFFAPDKAKQGLTSTFREITKIYKKGISADELHTFKTILHTKQTLLGDSLAGQLRNLHGYNCHGFSLKEIEEQKARISSVTLKEVNDAIKTYLNPASLTIGAAGPVKVIQKDIESFIKSVQ